MKWDFTGKLYSETMFYAVTPVKETLEISRNVGKNTEYGLSKKKASEKNVPVLEKLFWRSHTPFLELLKKGYTVASEQYLHHVLSGF